MNGVGTEHTGGDSVQLRVRARDDRSGLTLELRTRLRPSDLKRAYEELLTVKESLIELFETNPTTLEEMAKVLEPLDRIIYKGAFVWVFIEPPDDVADRTRDVVRRPQRKGRVPVTR